MKGGGKMADAQQINDFLVDAFGRINKIEERAMTTGLGSAISITEIHIIEKIGLSLRCRCCRATAKSKSACCANVWKTGKGALIFMRSDDLTSADPEHGLPGKRSFSTVFLW